MFIRKINEEGIFTPFPGVTIISKIKLEDIDFWKQVYSVLTTSQVLQHYFTPLPFESYHMTAINLFTQASDAMKNWHEFINKRLSCLQELNADLTKCQFNPSFTLKRIEVTGAIQLIIRIPSEHKKMIYAIANKFGITKSIPKEFHITLAYQYKAVPKNFASECQSLVDHLTSLFANKVLALNPPALCYFHDMGKFIPWDAKNDPFVENANDLLQEQEEEAYKRQDPKCRFL